MAEVENRFSPRLRQALLFANQEALRLRSRSVMPEHAMLGMLREGSGLASAALRNLGVDLDSLRADVETLLQPGAEQPSANPPYDPALTRMIEVAASEADSMATTFIGQEHILLAILRDREQPLSKLLAGMYVTYEIARDQVVTVLYVPSGERPKVKRYNLALPEDLFRQVENLASRENTTVLDVLRRSVKVGLLIAEVQRTPGAAFLIREGTTERQLVLL